MSAKDLLLFIGHWMACRVYLPNSLSPPTAAPSCKLQRQWHVAAFIQCSRLQTAAGGLHAAAFPEVALLAPSPGFTWPGPNVFQHVMPPGYAPMCCSGAIAGLGGKLSHFEF